MKFLKVLLRKHPILRQQSKIKDILDIYSRNMTVIIEKRIKIACQKFIIQKFQVVQIILNTGARKSIKMFSHLIMKFGKKLGRRKEIILETF